MQQSQDYDEESNRGDDVWDNDDTTDDGDESSSTKTNNSIDTGINEAQLLKLYNRAFPSIQVSDVLNQNSDCSVIFKGNEATDAILVTAHVPILDHIFSRDSLPTVCVPHLYINTTVSNDEYDQQPYAMDTIQDTIRAGKKLTRAQKGMLQDPGIPPSNRVLLSLAYTINRCWPQFTYVSLPLFLSPTTTKGPIGAHANMIFIQMSKTLVSIFVFEPNGVEAARDYNTESSLFPDISNQLPSLLKKPKNVEFQIVGSGIQTMLGEIQTRHMGRTTITTKRGYGICEAICMYIFSMFLKDPSQSLEEFDARFMAKLQDPKSRHAKQQSIMDFLDNLANWTEQSYAPILKRALKDIFRNSNVTQITVQYEGTKIAVTIPSCAPA